jgi:hypothetical protein
MFTVKTDVESFRLDVPATISAYRVLPYAPGLLEMKVSRFATSDVVEAVVFVLGGFAPELVGGAVMTRGVPIAVGVPAVCWRKKVLPPTWVTYAYQPVAGDSVGGEGIVMVEAEPVVVTEWDEEAVVSPKLSTYVIWTW